MLLLFLLCILAPGIVFGYLSLRRLESKFQQDTLRRMRFHTREVGMAVFSGIASMEEQVAFLSGVLGNGTPRDALSRDTLAWLPQSRFLLGVSRIREGSDAVPLYGKVCPPPSLGRHAFAHLASGKGLLYLERDPGGRHRAFIAHTVPGFPPEREMLSFEVSLDYLWGRVRDATPPVSEIVILSPDKSPLFQTQSPPSGLIERIGQGGARKEVSGHFEWGEGSEAQIVTHSAIFLKPAFHSDDWTVAVTQPRSEAFAATKHFTRILFMTVLLVLLVAGLYALVQIRRNLAPLSVLEEGTRRISGGDFESRVEIGSGDEFEALARSFNTMADHLGKEFRVQAALGKTVQAILGETDRDRIVRTLLDGVASVIPCDCAGLALLGTDGRENAADTFIRGELPTDLGGTVQAVMFLRPAEIDRLKSSETSLAVNPGREFDGFLSRWPGPRPETFLLSPLVSNGELTGIVLLGYKKAFDPAPEILVRLRQIADQTAIALSRAALVEELNENDLGTLQALSRAVDTNSPWTAGHSQRVTSLAMEIGWEIGLSEREIDVLQRGGLLHDLGKLGIPPAILDKPGKLTEEEYAVIQKHPSAGAEILRPIPSMEKILPIVLHHHERFDGSGYPQGLAGDSISLHARILSVADVADALSSDRPYRPGWQREKVLAYMLEQSGRQFDPGVVTAFLRIAARKPGASLTDLFPNPEHPANPVPWNAALSGLSGRAARGTSFSGYSETYPRG
ncbi:MAG: cyclic diguanylate phosphodiesterase [Deltaproteobacteria bacterium]|nr:cyclic diguanylate phosphodiesterase [Deltaproteobacteria bacterium]